MRLPSAWITGHCLLLAAALASSHGEAQSIAANPASPAFTPMSQLYRELGELRDWPRRLRHHPELIPAVLDAIRFDNRAFPEDALYAVEALTGLGPQVPAVELLRLVPPGHDLFGYASEAIGNSGNRAVVAALSESLQADPFGRDAATVVRALALLGVPHALPALRDWFQLLDAAPEGWLQARLETWVEGAAYAADVSSLPTLERIARHPDQRLRQLVDTAMARIAAANAPDPLISLLPWLTADPATAAMGDDPTWALHVIRSRQWTQFVPLLRQLLTTRVVWLRERGVVDSYNPSNPMMMDGQRQQVGMRMPFAFDLAWTLHKLGGELQPDELAVLEAEGFVEPEADAAEGDDGAVR